MASFKEFASSHYADQILHQRSKNGMPGPPGKALTLQDYKKLQNYFLHKNESFDGDHPVLDYIADQKAYYYANTHFRDIECAPSPTTDCAPRFEYFDTMSNQIQQHISNNSNPLHGGRVEKYVFDKRHPYNENFVSFADTDPALADTTVGAALMIPGMVPIPPSSSSSSTSSVGSNIKQGFENVVNTMAADITSEISKITTGIETGINNLKNVAAGASVNNPDTATSNHHVWIILIIILFVIVICVLLFVGYKKYKGKHNSAY